MREALSTGTLSQMPRLPAACHSCGQQEMRLAGWHQRVEGIVWTKYDGQLQMLLVVVCYLKRNMQGSSKLLWVSGKR